MSELKHLNHKRKVFLHRFADERSVVAVIENLLVFGEVADCGACGVWSVQFMAGDRQGRRV